MFDRYSWLGYVDDMRCLICGQTAESMKPFESEVTDISGTYWMIRKAPEFIRGDIRIHLC